MEPTMYSTTPTLLFGCSGNSSVGQIANEVCRHLAVEGHGKLSCLAGIGGHVSGMVEAAKNAPKVVAIDGCGVKCVRRTLEAAGVPVSQHIILTEEGFEKTRNLFPDVEDIQKAKNRVLAIVE